MARPTNPDLIVRWKINVPATVAGRVEHLLFNDLTGRPYYGARGKLITKLLEHWLAVQIDNPAPPLPNLLELTLED